MSNYTTQIRELLELTVKERASDLHLSCDHPPVLRVAGHLIPLIRRRKLTPEDTEGFAVVLARETQFQKLLKEKEIDFSYSFKEKNRFRVNIFFQNGTVACSLRLIPSKIRTIEELGLPPVLHKFTQARQGFVLITGPSSQGKSTTLAALIDEINHSRNDHIVTIEDPIEYVFLDDKSIVDQREVGRDTLSFSKALRSTFRQDPNVIMVGEMRDLETISTAITAAETGHLVFATLHTNSSAQTIHRIVDIFPADQQSQVRAQLSGSLLGIVSQRLVPRIKGGQVPVCEVLISTPAIGNLIRENKIHEMPLVIETSAEHGMISLNRSLLNLVKRKEISMENALSGSLNPVELKRLVAL